MRKELKNAIQVSTVSFLGATIIGGGTLIGGVAVYRELTKEDPGVQFCEHIRDSVDTEPASVVTEDDYQRVLSKVSESKLPEIREPGMRLVSLSWQAQQLGDDAGLEAVGLVGPIIESYVDLSSGCAQHDVVLPPLDFGGVQ